MAKIWTRERRLEWQQDYNDRNREKAKALRQQTRAEAVNAMLSVSIEYGMDPKDYRGQQP